MRSSTPVKVDVFLDGRLLKRVDCNRPDESLDGWNLPQKQRACFKLSSVKLTENKLLEIRDSRSGFVLDSKVIKHPD
jgi:hypothetical protein